MQLYLRPTRLLEQFAVLKFSDDFVRPKIDSSWLWVDETGQSIYEQLEAYQLEIHAANALDLYRKNLKAPRLIRSVSGDFSLVVNILSAVDNKPQIGGLLIWKDKNNFLRFEKGIYGPNEMRFHGYANGNYRIAGRGLLSTIERNDEIYLRLERSGDEFSAYCSVDEENWFTCGKMILPMEDPIQVGIHAIGMIDRTIYCGEYKEGTATVFKNFRIWTREFIFVNGD